MNVLLIHGFWDTGDLFRHLKKRLGAAGHTCFSPTLKPRDGWDGLADLAEKLSVYIEQEIPKDEPFVVIGFSMGCLVARYYLQNLLKTRKYPAFFAISGPMQGTVTANLYPGKGARDMRPNSEFLRELESSKDKLNTLEIHTYFTPLDLMIIPATSSRLAQANEMQVIEPLHRWVVKNEKVLEDIVSKLQRISAAVGAIEPSKSSLTK
jgi:triacylglycerol lipase